MKKILICLVLLAVALGAEAMDRITGRMFSSRSEVIAAGGMVATSQPLAAQVGIDILNLAQFAIRNQLFQFNHSGVVLKEMTHHQDLFSFLCKSIQLNALLFVKGQRLFHKDLLIYQKPLLNHLVMLFCRTRYCNSLDVRIL